MLNLLKSNVTGHVHSGIGLFDRFKYKLLFSKRIGTCTITFWVKRRPGYLLSNLDVVTLLTMIKVVMLSRGFGHRFNSVEVILNPVFMDFEHLLEKMEQGKFIGGYVKVADVQKDNNIITLNLEDLDLVTTRRLIEEYFSNNKNPKLDRPAIDALVEKSCQALQIRVVRTLVHELTHLWHLRTSQSRKIFEKNKTRLAQLLGNDSLESHVELSTLQLLNFNFVKIVDGKKHADCRGLREALTAYYAGIWNYLLLFEHMLVEEGLAVFMEDYLADKVTAPTISKIHKNAQGAARGANGCLQYIAKTLQPLCSPLTILLNEDRATPDRAIVVWEESGRALVQNCLLGMDDVLHKLHAVSYMIGPSIITRLYDEGNMSIQEIGSMNPNVLIRKYTDICEQNSIEPLIAVQPRRNAVCNLKDHQYHFNRIRKKLGIRTTGYHLFQLKKLLKK